MVQLAHYGAEPGSVILWQLDNEPDLWSSTHAEVHPTPLTYAELAQRNVEYATAIKAVRPTAHGRRPGELRLGGLHQPPGRDRLGGRRRLPHVVARPDEGRRDQRRASGSSTSSTCTGTRRPPAAARASSTTAPAAAEVAAREQAPRSLWDATYTETSWITQTHERAHRPHPERDGEDRGALPRARRCPSREWNYGGGTDISGAIASADVLGIFGAYGVDMANMWPMNGDESFTYAAFEAFRNYDGKGAAFGDTSVAATTTDVPDSSVYASLQSADASKLVLVAINKATTAKVAGVVIDHSTVYTKASVYTLTASGGRSSSPGRG